MNRSFEAGEAVQLPDAHSIASGLSPPYAGKQPFCIKYVSLVRSMVKGIRFRGAIFFSKSLKLKCKNRAYKVLQLQ